MQYLSLIKHSFVKYLFGLLTLISSAVSASPSQEFDQLLEQHAGKVIYVDFWASWCAPCKKSFPWMNQMQMRHQSEGFVVISINVDSETEAAVQFLDETPANFDVIYDPNGELATRFELMGMPSSFIVDRQGQFSKMHVGFNRSKQIDYENEIRTKLGASMNGDQK